MIFLWVALITVRQAKEREKERKADTEEFYAATEEVSQWMRVGNQRMHQAAAWEEAYRWMRLAAVWAMVAFVLFWAISAFTMP